MFQGDLLPIYALILTNEAADFVGNLNSHQTAQWCTVVRTGAQWHTVGIADIAALIADLGIETSYV